MKNVISVACGSISGKICGEKRHQHLSAKKWRINGGIGGSGGIKRSETKASISNNDGNGEKNGWRGGMKIMA